MVVLFMKLDVGKTVESLSFPTNLEREKALLSVASFIILLCCGVERKYDYNQLPETVIVWGSVESSIFF